jgi:hypothetical protein
MLAAMIVSRAVLRGAAGLVALVLGLAGAARAACPGDCDGSGDVNVSELVRGVNIALGSLPTSACPAFDRNGDGQVGVSELITAVNAALTGCPAEATATVTASPTPTVGIEPIFPANYRDSFIEVRDCRLGIEHGGVMIRVVANEVAAQPYLRNENPLPLGSIVIKEEYSGVDCSNDAELTRWTAMRKEMPGFDAEDGDWHWQWVEPNRAVHCDDKGCPGFPCIACHSRPECLARDYMCTVNDTPPRGVLQPVLEDLPAALLSVSGTSPTDVYAAGADPQDGRGPYVVHYDGNGWRRLDTGAAGDLWWISVTPIDGDFYLAGTGGLVLQYDPPSGRFTRHTTPNETAQLFGIWGTGAGNLWAVGGDEVKHAVLWHFDGMMWTAQDVSSVVPQDVPTTLYKVWGSSATDVYAVGETGTILHYNGVGWSLIDGGVSNPLFTVHGGGSVLAAVGGFFEGLIIERKDDGTFLRRTPSGAPQLNGVFVGPGSGNAVAVGNGLSVAVRDSSGWSLVNEGTDGQARDFHGVWVDPSDGIWAVGGDLAALSKGVLAYGGSQVVAGGPVQ